MLSYWANEQTSGDDAFPYHVVNVLIRCTASALMYFIVRRILEWAAVEPRLRVPHSAPQANLAGCPLDQASLYPNAA